MSIVIDEKKLRDIIHDEITRAIREILDEFEFMTEQDYADREEAIKQFKNGKAIDWNIYAKKRGI
ncbi:hypothetical protein DRQ33_03295 [bacterium]|nr:MAG: hypothetical protein DRQ33_03295 [bacterium]